MPKLLADGRISVILQANYMNYELCLTLVKEL